MRCEACHRRLLPGALCSKHPAAPTTAPAPPAPLRLELPGLDSAQLIGWGGSAQVFRARRISDGQPVAVKVALRPSEEPRLLREAEVMRALGPSIGPALHDTGRTAGGHACLILELIEGETLALRLAGSPKGALSPQAAQALLQPLCDTVDRLHAAGFVHRDLKPENIMLRSSGAVILLDFGLARPPGAAGTPTAGAEELTRAGDAVGTAYYMAPEQIRGEPVAAESDLYALAALVFELFAGMPPYVGDAASIQQGHLALRPPSLSNLADLAPAVDAVVARALAKRPTDRYARAADLAAALMQALANRALAPTVERRATKAAPRRVALLYLDGQIAFNRLNVVAQEHQGLVLQAGADACLLAFLDLSDMRLALRSAIQAAQALADDAARAVIHLASARVRESPRGLRLLGPDIERPHEWAPPGKLGDGIVLTAPAAVVLGSGLTAPAAWSNFFELGIAIRERPPTAPDPATVPLRGRAALCHRLEREAAQALASGTPTRSMLIGAKGSGKSRLLDELAARMPAGAQLIRIAGHPASGAQSDPALEDLCAALFGLQGASSPDEVRAALRKWLPPELASRTWPAIALALGALAPGSEILRPIEAVPGGLRQRTASAIAAALATRARQRPIAVLVDDAEKLDLAVLDAFERATADVDARLWICLASSRPLARNSSAEAEGVHEIEPLDANDAGALLLDLLFPVTHLAAASLERLLDAAQGLPLYLVELARALGDSGAIRRHPGATGWFLAGDEALRLAPGCARDRLSEIAIARLSPLLLRLARQAAILDGDVKVTDLDELRQLLAPEAVALDSRTALGELARLGLLKEAAPDTFRFHDPRMRDAIERSTPVAELRELHAAAYQRSTALPIPNHEQSARHATALGLHAEAGQLYRAAADQALRRHRYVDAERLYSAALCELADGLDRERALAGRGQVRYRLERYREAVDDLRAARSRAKARGDLQGTARLLLDEAAALDWDSEFLESARRVEEAVPLVEQLVDPALASRCWLAIGRDHFRNERWAESIAPLETAALRARELGEHEPWMIALLLLGSALEVLGRTEAAEARFEEAIAECRAAGDLLHLAAAHGNRSLVWMQRRDIERGLADLAVTIEIARELGNPKLESLTTMNQALLLYWNGQLDEALPLARRARELGLLCQAAPEAEDSLLVARILLALGQTDGTQTLYDWVDDHCPVSSMKPSMILFKRLIGIALIELARPGSAIEELAELVRTAPIESLLPDERLELLHFAARMAIRAGAAARAADWICKAASQPGAEHWASRLDELRVRAADAVPLK